MTSHSRAYSLIEMLISMAITCAIAGGAFRLIDIGRRTTEAGGEAADMLQRLRTVSVTIEGALMRAGAGAPNAVSDALAQRVPALLPSQPIDPPGTFRDDTFTVIYARSGAVQTTIAEPLTSVSTAFLVNQVPGCPLAQAACGLEAGDTVLIFDGSGNFDAFAVESISENGGAISPIHSRAFGIVTYDAGASIVPVERRTYLLKPDASGRPYQLVSYADGSPAATPVAEHVVRLKLDYFDDAASLTPMNGPDVAASPLRIRAVAVTVRIEAGRDALRGGAGPLFVRPGTATDITRTQPDIEAQFRVSLRNIRGVL